MIVATAWGIARTATACAVGIDNMSSGVSRLPMPKPETEATAPARTAAAPMRSSIEWALEIGLFGPHSVHHRFVAIQQALQAFDVTWHSLLERSSGEARKIG
jgi:hypothetical protein